MTTPATTLQSLVARRLDLRWSEFAREHPNLAAALDRVSLVEQAVSHLRDDPRYRDAMREADLDELRLAQAAGLLECIDAAVTLLLPR